MNSQEVQHMHMYDVIQSRLGDPKFFRSLAQQPDEPPQPAHSHSMVQKGNYLKPEEAKCYWERYSDVKASVKADDLAAIDEHFLTVGTHQGRYAQCGEPELTDIEAEAMILNYPEFQRLYGYNIRHTLAQTSCIAGVRKHLADGKARAKYPLKRPAEEEPFFVGGIGAKLDQCDGTVWMGFANSPIDNSTLATWGEFRMFNHSAAQVKHNVGDTCNFARFPQFQKNGSDDSFGCWCEPKVQYQPFKCADEGEDCRCDGVMVYGRKFSEADPKLALTEVDSVLQSPYLLLNASQPNTTCSNKAFGSDPAPFNQKQCFCDQHYQRFTEEDFKIASEEQQAEKEASDAAILAAKAAAEQESAAKIAAEAKKEKEAEEKAAQLKEAEEKKAAEAALKKAEDEAKAAQAATEAKREKEEKLAQELEAKAAQNKKEAEAKQKLAEKAAKKAQEAKDAAAKQAADAEAKKAQEEAVTAAVMAGISEEESSKHKQLAQKNTTQRMEQIDIVNKTRQEYAKRLSNLEQAEANFTRLENEKQLAQNEEEAKRKALEAIEMKAEMLKKVADHMTEEEIVLKQKLAQQLKQEQTQWTEKKAQLEARVAELQRQEKEAANKTALATETLKNRTEVFSQLQQKLESQREVEAKQQKALEKEVYEKEKAEQEARDKLLKAQRDEELCQGANEANCAAEAEKRAQRDLDEATEAKKVAITQKAELAQDLEKQRIAFSLAEEAKKEAEQTLAVAQKTHQKVAKIAADTSAKVQASIKKHEEDLQKLKEASK
jgi:hypothetical protein